MLYLVSHKKSTRSLIYAQSAYEAAKMFESGLDPSKRGIGILDVKRLTRLKEVENLVKRVVDCELQLHLCE